MADLRGKVALVTSAGSEAGRGVAEGLAEAGCGLWLVEDGSAGNGCEATRAAVEALGGSATLASAALEDAGAVARLLTRIYSEEGRLDIVVNVHGEDAPGLDAVPALLEDGGGLLIDLRQAEQPLAPAAPLAPGSAVTQLAVRTTAAASVRYAGRCIAALAMDPDVAEKHAGAFDIGTLADEYRFSELKS